MAQSFRGAVRLGYGKWGHTLSGLPILNAARATFTRGASNCLTGALKAWVNAGGPVMLIPPATAAGTAGVIYFDPFGWREVPKQPIPPNLPNEPYADPIGILPTDFKPIP